MESSAESELRKMTGMSPSHTARPLSLARSFRGETAIDSQVASKFETNHETWRESRGRTPFGEPETDIFVVISCYADGRRRRRTRQFWLVARTIFHKEQKRERRKQWRWRQSEVMWRSDSESSELGTARPTPQ